MQNIIYKYAHVINTEDFQNANVIIQSNSERDIMFWAFVSADFAYIDLCIYFPNPVAVWKITRKRF